MGDGEFTRPWACDARAGQPDEVERLRPPERADAGSPDADVGAEGYFTRPWAGAAETDRDRTDGAGGARGRSGPTEARSVAEGAAPTGSFTGPWRGGGPPIAEDPGLAEGADRLPTVEEALAGDWVPIGADPPPPPSEPAPLPSTEVAAETKAAIAALDVQVDSAGPQVWHRALTLVEQGFARCDLLDLLGRSPAYAATETDVAAALAGQRDQLTQLREHYEALLAEHARRVARADEISAETAAFVRAEEAKRQAYRDEVAKAQVAAEAARMAQDRERADQRHTAYLKSVTDKYWAGY